MERLTRPDLNVDPDTDRFLSAKLGGKEIDWKQCRDSTLNVLINGPTSNGFCKDIFRKMVRDLYGRLKAYEDTGLTPAEVHSMYSEWNAMMSVLNSIGSYDRLRELAEADKDGRLVVLPCKVGDELWTWGDFSHGREVYRFTVSDVSTMNGRTVLNTLGLGTIRPEDIGKTVFFTREEAERAMEGRP